jgi:protoporphyrinogen oxidase
MINVIRDIPAPASLAAKTSYRNDDVIDALYHVFRKKCYLTEKVFDSLREMEIDHFIPQNEEADLIHVWRNLYPIDNKANKQRPKTVPVGGYLDPCDPADDVEQEILYIVEFGGNALFKPRDSTNQKAVNTADLLNRVHRDLKEAISKRHHEVVDTVAKWYHAKKYNDSVQELEQELTLRKLLSRDSQYTMLMRSIWVVPHEFFD